ncbi:MULTISPECIES: hypothetical protein [unclassified Streptomyces]|uniref:hypothetical protein n=1 Tax=unclassified Streptomyces TaxID=2593676 RepID=UPI0033B156AD
MIQLGAEEVDLGANPGALRLVADAPPRRFRVCGDVRHRAHDISYLRDTDTVLAEKPSPAWAVRAVEPPEDDGWVSWARDLWRQVADAITGLGGLAVSVSAIAAVAAMVIRRRLPALGPEDEEAAESVRGAAPGTRPRPAPRVRSRPGRAGAARNLRYARRIRTRAGPRT